MKRVALSSLLTLAFLTTFGGAASAENPTINVQGFKPAMHEGDLFITNGSHVPEHLRWTASLLLNFGKNPLVFVDTGTDPNRRHEVIQNQLTLDLMGTIAIADWVDVGLGIPLFLLNSGDDGFVPISPEISSFALGDIRLSPKVKIINREWVTNEGYEDGFGLAVELGLGLPTGNADSFVSDGFSFTPMVIADYKAGPALIALNLGAKVRGSDSLEYLDVGSEFFWRAGVSVDVLDRQLAAIGEIYGTSDFGDANTTFVEGIIGGRYFLEDVGLNFSLGGGSGFTQGYGSTKFRLFFGAGYAEPIERDADGDGLLDPVDECPNDPEDKDQFEDDNGCPDPDNDQDGILDAKDRCPNDKEDKDGYQDDDGCPELDNDGDGILDADDKCPDQPEDKDGFEDDDGCPDTDNDNDGILDADDKCPMQPEVKNGFEDEDGCPDETKAKVENNKIVISDRIYFDYQKDTIKPESFPVLTDVANILKANPQIKNVRIEGHTDDRGNANANRKLSQRRADAVKAWLVDNGVEGGRLEAIGHGEDKPMIAEKTKEAREKNRRVEFLILGQ